MDNLEDRDIYFSFFMFTANLMPDDREYSKTIVRHIGNLRKFGYAGFDLPIAPGATTDHRGEIESYKKLRKALQDGGVGDAKYTTNVAATRTFDPSSPYKEQRDTALGYLKSRVDITAELGGHIMAGPVVLPYAVFPTTDAGQAIWSDALQKWLEPRYAAAQPVLEELGEYAASRDVKVAIEPVDHWETPAPNLVRDVIHFLDKVRNESVGVCIDSAHVVLGSDGPAVFAREAKRVLAARRLHYVHISAPDRGAVEDSWIPWKSFLRPILEGYEGPFLVEVFNAIPVFLNGLRITRREFGIEGKDPEAYKVAREAIATLRREMRETLDGAGRGQSA